MLCIDLLQIKCPEKDAFSAFRDNLFIKKDYTQ